MNTTSFIGRLTKDPEVRTTTSGPVADLQVAVDGPNDRAVYVTVTVFGAQVDAAAEHVPKGRQVGVTGRLAYDHGNQTPANCARAGLTRGPGWPAVQLAAEPR